MVATRVRGPELPCFQIVLHGVVQPWLADTVKASPAAVTERARVPVIRGPE